MEIETAVGKLLLGQGLLALCCFIYIVWWGVSYRPDAPLPDDQLPGVLRWAAESLTAPAALRLLLFCLLGLSGLSGVALTVMALSEIDAGPSGVLVGIIMAGFYALLLVVTVFGFHRQVTAELLLITAWTGLMMDVVLTLVSAGVFSRLPAFGLLFCVGLALLFSLGIYLAYYHLPPWPAYFAGAAPLLADGLVSLIFFAALWQCRIPLS